MKMTSDWHIHSRNSCDSACITVRHLIHRAAEQGITDYGLTDHLHTGFNWPDIAASRREFESSEPSDRFHFGIEVSSVSQWELDLIAKGNCKHPVYGIREGGPAGAPPALAVTAEDMAAYSIEYVVAGVHWPLYVEKKREAVIRDYHRQMMFLAAHPLVTIIAHPWWWMGWWKDPNKNFYPDDPWLDDFAGKIPPSMHEEFAAATREHGKVVEINLSANLFNPAYPEAFAKDYLQYIGFLKSKGVRLSIGSDCHDGDYAIDFDKTAAMLDTVGIVEDDLWVLEPRGV